MGQRFRLKANFNASGASLAVQVILRALSVGVSAVTVVITAAFVVLVAQTGIGLRAVLPAAALALLLITGLRQSARTLALVSPEATGLLLARPILLLQLLLAPAAWFAAAPARALVRLVGRDPDADEANPAAELLAMLERAGGSDGDHDLTEERRMMRGILAMSEQTVREVLSPRIDLAALSTDASIGDAMKLINETGFSRIPLYEESVDHIIGVIYAKDLLAYLRSGDVRPSLREIARPPYFVPETKRVDELLSDMRRDQVHMAIAVDEYGGTAGVVTVEDLLEEIVGEIADEYDVEDVDVQRLSDDEVIVDARLSIDDLNELFATEIGNEDFDTVGGLVLSLLGRLAVPGDEVISEDHRLALRVLSILGRRIKKVRVTRVEPDEAAEAG
jgi:CBS domain containing-hemolysin-like protein